MPAFKDELDRSAAGRLASELSAAWPEFPSRRFLRELSAALEPLALLARSDLLADRLVASLPSELSDAVAVLRRALESASFTGWIVLPCGGFVARAGLDEPDLALPLLAELTPRWSSELAIRPFIERHPDRTYEHLQDWLRHDDEHVRRLVSEGTRPRLPWARQLRALVQDPTANVPLLDALVSDRSPYVRRSVANHLNDITKDHPEIALDLATRWISLSEPAAAVVRQGLRTLIKRGDRRALDLLGVGDDVIELTDLTVDDSHIAIGDDVELTFTLALPATAPAPTDCDRRLPGALRRRARHAKGAQGLQAHPPPTDTGPARHDPTPAPLRPRVDTPDPPRPPPDRCPGQRPGPRVGGRRRRHDHLSAVRRPVTDVQTAGVPQG